MKNAAEIPEVSAIEERLRSELNGWFTGMLTDVNNVNVKKFHSFDEWKKKFVDGKEEL